MKPYLFNLILITCYLLASVTASAEVYRWTDKDGKLRYSDKRPKKVAAEDITATVNKQNIDNSGDEHKKLETIFRKENDADRAFQAEQNRPSAEKIERCEAAKDRLFKLEGPVNFVDKEGKSVKVSEKERESRAVEMRKFIADNC
ncbi:MAG TPA: DUF4124 domain-containing protein [Cellvibrio sp.]|nr:DUF4124 domain-containing protein [Cellvibrio sp.]